ncbi:glycoside hydrolase family 73 protein [Bacillus sp. FJAT-27986]|uniref:glycoside hydrolase family 73 protein n=1 Tax=Bacillus sp. FJAT-27986 TaxID=1743146 RepID=UPI00080AE727|nr:glucosaminidase domain-containing protein [Bacillus sp. FJAT-27986]OCA86778.1 hypothetical protein A8L44_05720 [Bacillus sp. FJAT-27986]
MKPLKLVFFAMIAIMIFVLWKMFPTEQKTFITNDRMKEIQSIVDNASKGKVQANWQNVAAIAAIEYNIDTVEPYNIEQTTNLFIEKEGNEYKLKNIEKVMDTLNYTDEQKSQVKSYITYLDSFKKGNKSNQYEFIAEIESAAVDNYKEYGILPSITIAQAILESEWGKSGLSQKYNNLFGIKGHNWDGAVASMDTKEFHNQKTKSDFRAYNSIDESIDDHGAFLKENQRYEKHGLFEANTYMEQAQALEDAGYSTAENEKGEKIYSKMLTDIIQQYQLQLIDSNVTSDKL